MTQEQPSADELQRRIQEGRASTDHGSSEGQPDPATGDDYPQRAKDDPPVIRNA